MLWISFLERRTFANKKRNSISPGAARKCDEFIRDLRRILFNHSQFDCLEKTQTGLHSGAEVFLPKPVMRDSAKQESNPQTSEVRPLLKTVNLFKKIKLRSTN
jgi:hypothetical protein